MLIEKYLCDYFGPAESGQGQVFRCGECTRVLLMYIFIYVYMCTYIEGEAIGSSSLAA